MKWSHNQKTRYSHSCARHKILQCPRCWISETIDLNYEMWSMNMGMGRNDFRCQKWNTHSRCAILSPEMNLWCRMNICVHRDRIRMVRCSLLHGKCSFFRFGRRWLYNWEWLSNCFEQIYPPLAITRVNNNSIRVWFSVANIKSVTWYCAVLAIEPRATMACTRQSVIMYFVSRFDLFKPLIIPSDIWSV